MKEKIKKIMRGKKMGTKIGLKDDKGKVMVHLVLPNTIIGMGEVLTFGAEKYEPNTWQNVKEPEDTHYAALMRHLLSWRNGECLDKESGLSHMKHVLTNAMFLLDHEQSDRIIKGNDI